VWLCANSVDWSMLMWLCYQREAVDIVHTIGQAFDICQTQTQSLPSNGRCDKLQDVSGQSVQLDVSECQQNKHGVLSTVCQHTRRIDVFQKNYDTLFIFAVTFFLFVNQFS